MMPTYPPEPFRIKKVEPIQLILRKEREAALKESGCNFFRLRVVIAFAPIDHENTLMYIRYYHNLRLPLLRQLYGWLGSLGNLVIERQDRRVVITQRPHRPDLGIGETLIQGDSSIVLYRKIRRALIEG